MLVDIAIGAVTWFLLLVLQKSVIEPVATQVGRDLIERYLEDCCMLLDSQVARMGLDFDAEAMLRQYLQIQPEKLSDEEMQELLEAVFTEWDLRIAIDRNHLVD